MDTPYLASPDTWVIPSHQPSPGFGLLPINAFLIESLQPTLIDSGMAKESRQFMRQLRSLIDPRDLKWVVFTHEESDHTGSLEALLEEAPNARIVINWLVMAKLSGDGKEPPINRVHLINPGQSIDLGDRRLHAMRPPAFDSPATLAFFEDYNRSYFGADAFGGLLQQTAENIEDVPHNDLVQGMSMFTRANSPWLRTTDRSQFAAILAAIRNLSPELVLSAHAPVARGKTAWLLEQMAQIQTQPEFIGPDQVALENMLAQMSAPAA